MFRAPIFAVLAVALSSSPAFAQQVDAVTMGETTVVESFGQRVAFATAGSTSLVISAEAVLSVTSPASLVPFEATVSPEAASITRRGTPWWPTALAIAGPLADGLSTVYAMRRSGPNARVVEGNGFYHKLFGANVKAREIMAFKVAQAAFMGYGVHVGGKHSLERAVGSAILQSAVNFWVASRNMKAASLAKRLNAGVR